MAKRILVVEDEPSIADNITYALSTEGFVPVLAGTGGQASELLRSGGLALMVLDVGLPDMSGFDLLRELRRTSDLPVIVLTSRGSEVDRVVGLELGADDYIVKPFSPRELTARVRTVLRRTEPRASVEAQARPTGRAHPAFEVDEARHLIRFHGTALDLSRYEHRLLLVFVRNPGVVFTRERLMELVWEEPEMSLDRTVDTHIKTLRQKLKALRAEEDMILTHRGTGYSLKEPA